MGDDEFVPDAQVVSQTHFLSILSQILAFEQSSQEELYFLKLEALWTLINMSMCGADELMLIL